MDKPIVLVVDDEPINITVLRKLLSPYYQVKACKTGEEALRSMKLGSKPEMVLLDINMPGMDGYTVLAHIRKNPEVFDIPVIFITALDSIVDEEKGFRLGAVDYITKPFRPAIVLERIKVHLEFKHARDALKNQNDWLEAEVERRMHENQLIQDAALGVISQLAETRDADIGDHVLHAKSYVEILARSLQRNSRYARELGANTLSHIVKATPLHDIGKIGIPDSILLKPGKLTPEEFEIMKTHSRIGGNAIRAAINKALKTNKGEFGEEKPTALAFLEIACQIATYHHERWDGSGYPDGLSGKNIPLSARIMAVADVFDALTAPRIYKKQWSIEDAIEHIRQQRGKHFDPDVVDAFLSELPAVRQVLLLIAEN
jgi:putative two-component system response regulator